MADAQLEQLTILQKRMSAFHKANVSQDRLELVVDLQVGHGGIGCGELGYKARKDLKGTLALVGFWRKTGIPQLLLNRRRDAARACG